MRPGPLFAARLLAGSLSTALAACSGSGNPDSVPPLPYPVVVPVAPVTAAASAAPTAETTARLPSLVAIEFPAASACVLQAADWSPLTGQPTPLSLRPEGPAFATVRSGKARLSFPEGERPAGQILEVSDRGLTIRGVVASSEVDLRAATSFSLNGFVYPTVVTRLSWLEAKPPALVLTVDVPEGLEPLSTLRGTRACADLAIDGAASWSPEDQLAAGRIPTAMELSGSAPVTLWAEPGKGALAKLRAPPGPESVSVLARKGAYAEVAWNVGTVVVHGWVESRALVPAKPAIDPQTWGGFGRRRAPHDEERVVQCTAEVAVTAAMVTSQVRVGEIAAGTRIEVLPTPADRDWVDVRVRDAGVVPTLATTFVAERAVLAGCAVVGP